MNSSNRPTSPFESRVVAQTRPPAKLNLFLEILARRDDGYHEIDTVMVPIDWCDELSLRRRLAPGIELNVNWMPSPAAIAIELGLDPDSMDADRLLTIPNDQSNLVHRALSRFTDEFSIDGGFVCELGKSIPAGAGMGGASSDAASALRCAALLCGIDPWDDRLLKIAADIGSDVPFFMGAADEQADDRTPGQPKLLCAARATGRGEKIEPLRLAKPIHFVVVYPPTHLSTALVYANCRASLRPEAPDRLIAALGSDDHGSLYSTLLNRLTLPAKKLAPQISETLESMWRIGLRTCQLTGSGSACFAITSSSDEAMEFAQQIRMEMIGYPESERGARRLGIRSKAAQSVSVPAEVELKQLG